MVQAHRSMRGEDARARARAVRGCTYAQLNNSGDHVPRNARYLNFKPYNACVIGTSDWTEKPNSNVTSLIFFFRQNLFKTVIEGSVERCDRRKLHDFQCGRRAFWIDA